jgi:putative hydrolase of the HAD superfamily
MTLEEQIKALSRRLDPRPTELQPRVEVAPGIKAVIFDVYGTLFISGSGDISLAKKDGADQREEAIRGAMRGVGFEILDSRGEVSFHQAFLDAVSRAHEQHQAGGVEYPEVEIRSIWREVLETLERERAIRGQADSDLVNHLAVEFECRVNPVWPMPDAVEAINLLRGEVKLGIVSNAQFYTPLMFRAFFDRSHTALGFERELCIWSYEHGRGKPSVELFQTLLRKLEKEPTAPLPDEVLYVGNDMLNDVWTANEAGLKTCLFAGDDRSLRLRQDDARCRDLKPDFVVTELLQVAEICGVNSIEAR